MKHIYLLFLLLAPFGGETQFSFGVKAGLNFVNVSSEAGIQAKSRSGYHIGARFGTSPKRLLGYRSEILLSRQGYDYRSAANTGQVNLDYLLIPQLMSLHITKKFELHAGLQIGFLLNAAADSSGGRSTGLLDYFNRFNYAVAGGGEFSPIGGLFLGARMNISLNRLNEDPPAGSGNPPAYIPKDILRNNVIQVYAGWRL